MTSYPFKYSFNLQGKVSVDIARKDFGALLKRLNLRYRTEVEFCGYQYSSPSSQGALVLDFLILPPEFQKDTWLENLRLLNQSYLEVFLADHQSLGVVTSYRNLIDFPSLFQSTADWWK